MRETFEADQPSRVAISSPVIPVRLGAVDVAPPEAGGLVSSRRAWQQASGHLHDDSGCLEKLSTETIALSSQQSQNYRRGMLARMKCMMASLNLSTRSWVR